MTGSISPPAEQRPEAWGSLAETYDLFAESVTCHFAEDAARLVHLGWGSQVIDVAAGTGAFTLEAARRGADVLATDFSTGMLDKLERKCAEHGVKCSKSWAGWWPKSCLTCRSRTSCPIRPPLAM